MGLEQQEIFKKEDTRVGRYNNEFTGQFMANKNDRGGERSSNRANLRKKFGKDVKQKKLEEEQGWIDADLRRTRDKRVVDEGMRKQSIKMPMAK